MISFAKELLVISNKEQFSLNSNLPFDKCFDNYLQRNEQIIDKRLSGKWLVTSIKHIIGSIGKTEGTTYNMIIEVTRDGVSACVPDRESRKEE